jgi:1,2-phenylacetyl-CoA epoxidase PaaB subunit
VAQDMKQQQQVREDIVIKIWVLRQAEIILVNPYPANLENRVSFK